MSKLKFNGDYVEEDRVSHTPGPWRADYEPHEHAWKISDGWNVIGQAHGPENARLIAACPEMLHALKLAQGFFRDAARTSPQHFAGYFKAVTDAIAKAEGRSDAEG